MSEPILLAGAANFRDLGGHLGAGGRRVRQGLLFRSSHLADLTAADKARLSGIGLDLICDFRGLAERAERPDAVDVPIVSLAIEPSVAAALRARVARGEAVGAGDAVAAMADCYRGYVRRHAGRFAALFAHILKNDGPLVFHCSAGKDRTGFAAALILAALGVDWSGIVADYLLTNSRWREDGSNVRDLPPAAVAVLAKVQVAFIEAAFAAIRDDFGGVDGFLAGPIGVGATAREALRARLLG